jgi:hypothetical protein
MTTTSKARITRAKVATKSGRYLQFNIDPRTHSEARYCVSVVNRLGVGVSMSTIVRLAIARYAADLHDLHRALVLKRDAFGTIAEVEVTKKQLERANKGGAWREFSEPKPRQSKPAKAVESLSTPDEELAEYHNGRSE